MVKEKMRFIFFQQELLVSNNHVENCVLLYLRIVSEQRLERNYENR